MVVRIYGGGPEVASDVEYLRTRATSSERVLVKEPTLEILDVEAKYGPVRFHIHCPVHDHKVYPNKLQEHDRLQTIRRAERLASVSASSYHCCSILCCRSLPRPGKLKHNSMIKTCRKYAS